VKIEIKIDGSCQEPKVIVMTDRMNEEVNSILQKLSEEAPAIITGTRDECLEIIEQQDIIRIYAGSGKVIALSERGEFVLRQRLYELEEKLDSRRFIRISNSEIINLKKVQNFDLSITGTICVRFKNGSMSYVSRRYVQKIKQVLGV